MDTGLLSIYQQTTGMDEWAICLMKRSTESPQADRVVEQRCRGGKQPREWGVSSGAVWGASRSRCCHWGGRQGWTLLGLLEQSEELGLPPVRGEERRHLGILRKGLT